MESDTVSNNTEVSDPIVSILLKDLTDFGSIDRKVYLEQDFFPDSDSVIHTEYDVEEITLQSHNTSVKSSMVTIDWLEDLINSFNGSNPYGVDHSQDQFESREADALYRKPHGSPFQQTLLMGSTDEFNPKAASFDINALRLGTTGIDNHSIHAGESQSQIEPDNLLAPLFFESNIPESVPNVELFRVSVSPCPLQRARYEDECSKGNRFIFVPYDGILTVEIPDLRLYLPADYKLWLRTTRITREHGATGHTLVHPYPIWIKNVNAKIHGNSIYIPVTEDNMKNGFIEIKDLVMIRLRQCHLAKVSSLTIYSPMEMIYIHPIEKKRAKEIINEYSLRFSTLRFQLVVADANNVARCTDAICDTNEMQEYEAKEMEGLRNILDMYGVSIRRRSPIKNKVINRKKRTRAKSLKKNKRLAHRREKYVKIGIA